MALKSIKEQFPDTDWDMEILITNVSNNWLNHSGVELLSLGLIKTGATSIKRPVPICVF